MPIYPPRLFEIFDIPDIFQEDIFECTFLNRLNDNISGEKDENGNPVNVDPADAFNLTHFSNRFNLQLNWLYASTVNDSRFRNIEGRTAIIHGIFAIVYSVWDFKFEDSAVGIDSGYEQLKKYILPETYDNFSQRDKFILSWFKKNVDLCKIGKIMNLMKTPFSEDYGDLDELHVEIVKIIRDAIVFSPVYSVSYYPKEYHNIHNFAIGIVQCVHYGVRTPDEIIRNIDLYYSNKKPYTVFAKHMISVYNSANDTGHILNQDAIDVFQTYLSSQLSDDESNNRLRRRNILEFTENSNIY